MSTVTENPSKLQTLFDCIVDEYADREAWLDGRRSCIGASDSAAILNEGYADQSLITIYDSKANSREDEGTRERLQMGTLMQPGIRNVFEYETGLQCIGVNPFAILRHRETPWLGASLDEAVVHEEHGPCPVELKNVDHYNKAEWDTDEGPLKFNIQVQHQIAVTGASHGYLCGVIGGNKPIVKLVKRNDRFIGALLDRLRKFWGYVERKEVPPIDDSAATGKLLSKLWKEDEGKAVMLPPESEQWATELAQAKATIKAAEAMKVAAENKIKHAIAEATYGQVPGPGGQLFSWKTQNRSGYYVEPNTIRVLLPVKAKK